jgi:tetratricopeptide (TPR) repeat protein
VSTTDDWATRVAALRDEAATLGTAGDLDGAMARITRAFAIVDGVPDAETHPVFVSLLCQAAELPAGMGDAESAAALFRRAYDLAKATHQPELAAKALWGLAEADVARGWTDRAAERFGEALELLAGSEHPQAPAMAEEIEAQRAALAPPPRRWWKLWG